MKMYKTILYLCIMFRAFKYRINPTEEQKILLNKHFGWSYPH